jgi:HAD superfamily hydrolase (TIGR01549 family)
VNYISPELALSRIRRLNALIFDLDGTLFISKRIALRMLMAKPADVFIVWAERRARKALFGCDCATPEAYYEQFFTLMAGKLGGKSPAWVQAWYFEQYMPRFCEVLQRHYSARAGAGDLFDALVNAGIRIAVYSDYPCVRERLAALGLRAEVFGTNLYGPEDFGAQKPAPRPFMAIAEELGSTPDATLIVGDRDDTDGAGALAAGMPYIRIVTHRKPSRPQYPSLSWEEFAQLVQDTLEKHRLPYAL